MAPHASANPGEFDLYLLAQTWAPQLCCVKSERYTTVAWAFSAKHLSLHGLWPGYTVPRGGSGGVGSGGVGSGGVGSGVGSSGGGSDDNGNGGATCPVDCAVKARLLAQQLPREYVDLAPAFTKWNPQTHAAEVLRFHCV